MWANHFDYPIKLGNDFFPLLHDSNTPVPLWMDTRALFGFNSKPGLLERDSLSKNLMLAVARFGRYVTFYQTTQRCGDNVGDIADT